MTTTLNAVEIGHLTDFFDDNDSFEAYEIEQALARKVTAKRIPAVPKAFGEWLKAVMHAYAVYMPLHDNVNGLYTQYSEMVNTSVNPPRGFELYPKRFGSYMMAPEVPVYDADLLSQEGADLKKRLLLLARAKVLKEFMRGKLMEAMDAMMEHQSRMADLMPNVLGGGM